MSLNNKRLSDINRLIKQKAETERALRDAVTPALTDYSQISSIYRICESTLSYLKSKDETRKVFVFITLYLYCPWRFFGGKMPHQMRRSIAQALGEGSPTRISTDIKVLIDMYIRGKFNKHVNEAYSAVEKELGI